ncbi:CinA-domain-containing protein [Hyaloscypha variabilis F]|jgi:nicotinamide-nucleotide amidase|uniref:CinA-domain-containing protein n=1 Tax=Hyaloscypha variabilis (strain UAMH 11265 / GT02V1 / F) TaxID=1149755 RepID=A0A2J6R796_HYAVF|nr:CinA-domain-containing protein [Hyaloscypha variabilis F]
MPHVLHHEIKYNEQESNKPAYLCKTPEYIANSVIEALKARFETLAIAESLTGGTLMGYITSVDGSSSVFRGGMVTYATPLKHKLLGVDPELILEHGVVDGEVALQMAVGVQLRTLINDVPTSWGVSTTGVASKWEENKEHGTVFIGISSDEKREFFGPFKFEGDREKVRMATAKEALVRLLQSIEDSDKKASGVENIVFVEVVD